MPTTKQKKVAEAIILNATLDKPLTGGEIVENSGYGESMSLYPGRILESEGVKQALNDFGFTEDNARQVVTEIMLDSEIDPSARLKATDQVFKVHGTYAAEKREIRSLNVDITLQNTDAEAIRLEFEDRLKQKLNESTT